MPYSRQTTRPVIMGLNGMITSSHQLASQAGLRALQDGGNAVDAAVTAAAVLAVVQPDLSGVGGDLFLLHHDAASGRSASLNASGRAPAEITVEALAEDRRRDGHGSYPPGHGPMAMTVPGAPRGWADAIREFGTIGLGDALEPAIQYAERGFPVSVRLARSMESSVDLLKACPAAASTFLVDGAPYRPGQVLAQPDLARTLRAIATDGPDAFYGGDTGTTIVRANRADGGFLSEDDLLRQDSLIGEPIAGSYRDCTVLEQPPVSLGCVLLEELALAEGFDLAALPLTSAERAHLLIEAKKVAFADLEAYLTDPEVAHVPVAGLLDARYAATRRQAIDPAVASDGYGAGDPRSYGSHTSYLAVVDGRGNAVSWIQSIFERFGSGWMAAGTGVLMNDRMNGFSVDPDHVNCVAAGKRTAHTLNAPMVLRDGKPCLVFGTPGGYGQVQSNLQMLTAFVDHDVDVAGMVETPRWLSGAGRRVAIESRFSDETRERLRALGHELEIKGAFSSGMGDAQAIRIDHAAGVLEAAADPRREGYAVGW